MILIIYNKEGYFDEDYACREFAINEKIYREISDIS